MEKIIRQEEKTAIVHERQQRRLLAYWNRLNRKAQERREKE